MTVLIVSVIIAVLASLMYTLLFSRAIGISVDPSVSQCQQSAALAGAIRVPGVDINIFDYTCPVSSKKITSASLDRKVAPEKLQAYGYSAADSRRYNLDRQMWQQVDECYQKVNYGVLPIFDRQGLLEAYGDEPSYCVICSRVQFDDKIIADFSSARPGLDIEQFVAKESLPSRSTTMGEMVANRNDVIGGTVTNYNVKKQQAVIYLRTPVKAPDRLLGALGLECVGQVIRDFCSIRAYTMYPAGQVLVDSYVKTKTGTGDYVVTDVDSVQIVDYEDQDSLVGLCTVIGNEKYVKG